MSLAYINFHRNHRTVHPCTQSCPAQSLPVAQLVTNKNQWLGLASAFVSCTGIDCPGAQLKNKESRLQIGHFNVTFL